MLYDMESNYIGIWKFALAQQLEKDNMYEEARANLLALANELEEQGEDGQAERDGLAGRWAFQAVT